MDDSYAVMIVNELRTLNSRLNQIVQALQQIANKR